MPNGYSNAAKRYYSSDYKDELIAALESIKDETDVDLSSVISNVTVPNGNAAIEECKEACLEAAQEAQTHVGSINEHIDNIIAIVTNFYSEVQSTGDEINGLTENANTVMEAFIASMNNASDTLDEAGRAGITCIEKDTIDECFVPMEIAEEYNSAFLYDYFTDENGYVDRETVQATLDKINEDPEGNSAYVDMYAQFQVEYVSNENVTDDQIEYMLNTNMEFGMVQVTDNSYIPEPGIGDGEVMVYYEYESTPALLLINERMYELNLERYNEEYDDSSISGGCSVEVSRVDAYITSMEALISNNIAIPVTYTVDELEGFDLDSDIASQDPRPFPNVITYDTTNTDPRTVRIGFGLDEAGNPNQEVRIYLEDGSTVSFVSIDIQSMIADLASVYSNYDSELIDEFRPGFGSGEFSLGAGYVLEILDLLCEGAEELPFLGLLLRMFDIATTIDDHTHGNDTLSRYQDAREYYEALLLLDRYYDARGSVITYNSFDGEPEAVVLSGDKYIWEHNANISNAYFNYLYRYYGLDGNVDADSLSEDEIIADATSDRVMTSSEFEQKVEDAFRDYCERTGLSGVDFDDLTYEQYCELAECIGNEEHLDELVDEYNESGDFL